MTSLKPSDFSEIIYADSGTAYRKIKDVVSKYEGWVVVMDNNTNKHCLPVLTKKLEEKPRSVHILHAGENNKTIDRCSSIWTKLTELQASRNYLIINLGGGLVSDIGGFAASCFKRGIDFINIPTTLLAMVDAAHGGKTGLNYKGVKNMIGSIKMPKYVLIDQDYLKSLEESELISGYAEVLKHALIADSGLWNELKKYKSISEIKDWTEILRRSVEIKNNIVKSDPFELGERKLLNFGHSVGHAIEAHSHSPEESGLSHGLSVAVGMIVESHISVELGLLEENECNEIEAVISSVFDRIKMNELMHSDLLSFISHDKKNVAEGFNFTLLSSIGKGVIDQIVDPAQVGAALNKYSLS